MPVALAAIAERSLPVQIMTAGCLRIKSLAFFATTIALGSHNKLISSWPISDASRRPRRPATEPEPVAEATPLRNLGCGAAVMPSSLTGHPFTYSGGSWPYSRAIKHWVRRATVPAPCNADDGATGSLNCDSAIRTVQCA